MFFRLKLAKQQTVDWWLPAGLHGAGHLEHYVEGVHIIRRIAQHKLVPVLPPASIVEFVGEEECAEVAGVGGQVVFVHVPHSVPHPQTSVQLHQGAKP